MFCPGLCHVWLKTPPVLRNLHNDYHNTFLDSPKCLKLSYIHDFRCYTFLIWKQIVLYNYPLVSPVVSVIDYGLWLHKYALNISAIFSKLVVITVLRTTQYMFAIPNIFRHFNCKDKQNQICINIDMTLTRCVTEHSTISICSVDKPWIKHIMKIPLFQFRSKFSFPYTNHLHIYFLVKFILVLTEFKSMIIFR